MAKTTFSERLTHLRGLVADGADTNSLLLAVDLIISCQRQLQVHLKQNGLDALRQETKTMTCKLKEVARERKELEETAENLKSDLEIMRVKCQNLEERLKKQNHAAAREKRAKAKHEQKKTKECEVQVDTLSMKMMEDLTRSCRSEMRENQRLRQDLQELRDTAMMVDVDVSMMSTVACQEDALEFDDSASFSAFMQDETAIHVNLQMKEETPNGKQSVLDRLWTKSKQIITYFKDQ